MRGLMAILILFLGCTNSQREVGQKVSDQVHWFFWSVDWHPVEDKFVVGGSKNSFLKVFDADGLKELYSRPFHGTITKTKWHPSKNVVAVSTQDPGAKSAIISLDDKRMVTLDSVSVEGARAIGWNHSGEILAVGDYEGALSFYRSNGDFIKKIATSEKSIIGLDWHPEENRIVAVGESVVLYDYASDSISRIDDRKEDVLMLCVAWHPEGEFFVTGDYGDFEHDYPPLLQYWTEDGVKIKSIEESKAEYRNMVWSRDLLATASEKIRLWSTEGQIVAESSSDNLLWGIDWNADGSKVVTTDEGGRIVVWDRNLIKLSSSSLRTINRAESH